MTTNINFTNTATQIQMLEDAQDDIRFAWECPVDADDAKAHAMLRDEFATLGHIWAAYCTDGDGNNIYQEEV